jgi:Ca2+-binding RTX toxin-like protein
MQLVQRFRLVVVVLAVIALGLVAVAPAGAQGYYVGIWHGPKNPPGDDGNGPYGLSGDLTFAIDEDDSGNLVFFAYDSEHDDCSGAPGAVFGRGETDDSVPEGIRYSLSWDGVYCLDGTFHSSPGSRFLLWADPNTGYVQLSPETHGNWWGYPLCDPDGEYVPEGMNVVWGTDDDDTINGTKGPDVICAGKGDDRIWGRGGDDIVVGGDGADELYGNNGMDILWGGLGNDALYGGFHTDGVFGGDGDDEVKPQASADFGYGGYGADALDGFFGHDRLEGGPGDDDVWGRNGNDLLLGGTGNDFLSGGTGSNDTADGEDGRDTCNAETETNCEF